MEEFLWLAFKKINGVGPRKILDVYTKNPQLTYEAILEDNNLPHPIRLDDMQKFVDYVKDAKDELVHSRENGIEVITYDNPRYPMLLKLIPDPPIVIYCKGNLKALDIARKIAVIGTRDATPKGLQVAEKIAYEFAKRGFVIVSGLAFGIDTAGHKGALDANGHTIAVMPCGLDQIYPKKNKYLADLIIEKEGLLLSEYPIGVPPQKQFFVQRDRIQSGLSLGIFPIQTDVKGGTMHTVGFAEKQKRLIVCPKPVESVQLPQYLGIQKLLDENRATVLESVESYDMIETKLLETMTINFPDLREQWPELASASDQASNFVISTTTPIEQPELFD
jgi:DNA processing protein